MSKGPRALGLLELAPNGKAHLIPVVIMYQGQFYDASAYKAAPVPMALEPQTVYEAERSGKSLGLFTITGVRQLKNNFIADGRWEPGGPRPAKQVAESKPAAPAEDQDKPPVLRHPGQATEKPQSAPPPAPKPQAPQPSPTTAEPGPQDSDAPPVLKKPASEKSEGPPPTPPSAAQSSSAPQSTAPASDEDDSGRPVLRRGKPEPAAGQDKSQPSPTPLPTPKHGAAGPLQPGVQLIPAISDAHGPEPHSYVFDMTPKEEQEFRQKLLAMATSELAAYKQELVTETIDEPKRAGKRVTTAGKPQPSFTDVQLHTFDLSDSNEPTLVFTAKAHMPQTANGASSDLEYYITLVARNDIYDQLHKGFTNITDSQHLDVTPELQLIDAVDVDGDGRGELLFRKTSDQGSTYVIYRVIGDQLYALYEGTTGG